MNPFKNLQIKTLLASISYQLPIIVVSIAGRALSISSKAPYNPDEAVLAAWMRSGDKSLVPFKSVVTNTSGPGWVFVLGILRRVGLPATIPVVHLLALTILILTLVTINGILKLYFTPLNSLLLVLPISLYLSTGGQAYYFPTDLLSLTTESLPILLVVLAIYIRCLKRMPNFFLVLLGIAFSMKYQFAFISVAIIAWVAYCDLRVKRGSSYVKDLGLKLLVFSAPYCLLIIWAIIGRAPWENIIDSLLAPINYSTGGRVTESVGILKRFNDVAKAYLGNFIVLYSTLVGLVLLITNTQLHSSLKLKNVRFLVLIYSSIPVTLWVTNPIFAHYLQIPMYLGLPLFGLVISGPRSHNSERAKLNWKIPRRASKGLILMSMILFLGSLEHVKVTNNGTLKFPSVSDFTTDGAMTPEDSSSQVRQLRGLCPKGSDVLVWGWAAELYSYYDWKPAGPLVETSSAMNANYDSQNASKIVEETVLREKPVCIIEAITWQFFGNFNPQSDQLIKRIPAIAETLQNNYIKLSISSTDLPNLQIYKLR